MTKTERLKQYASELNEKFPVGTIVTVMPKIKEDGSHYWQEHPESRLILDEFTYRVPSHPADDEYVNYGYADLDMILSKTASLENYMRYADLYSDNEWEFAKASTEDVRKSAKQEIDWNIAGKKDDIKDIRKEIQDFRSRRRTITEEKINSVVDYILGEEKKKRNKHIVSRG